MENSRTQKRDWLIVTALLAVGLALRVFFNVHGVSQDDDTEAYQELARNLLHHGVYGFSGDTGIDPTLIRLPGYPLFLAAVFAIFGDGHMRVVECLQALLDLVGCWLIFDTARREVSQRAGWAALALAVLCPFTAAYAASGMTESLSIMCVAVAIWATARLLRAVKEDRSTSWSLAALAAATACAILLRPDGGLLAASFCFGLFWYAKDQVSPGRALRLALLAGVLALLPLVPWAIRNYRVFHVFQPLAPRNANNPGEFVPNGFHRWMRTWSIEFVNTGTVAWNMGTDPIDLDAIPARACDPGPECREMAATLAAYNVDHAMTPAIDARFGALADEHIRRHPLDYYVVMPVLRVLDMGLRPRTELFDVDVFWWRIREHPLGSAFAIGLALINLVYIVLAVLGFASRRVPLAVALLLYVLLRSLLLATMENPEQRYTVEVFPILFLAGACALGGKSGGRGTAGHSSPRR